MLCNPVTHTHTHTHTQPCTHTTHTLSLGCFVVAVVELKKKNLNWELVRHNNCWHIWPIADFVAVVILLPAYADLILWNTGNYLLTQTLACSGFMPRGKQVLNLGQLYSNTWWCCVIQSHSSQGFLGHLLSTSAAGMISDVFKMSTRQKKKKKVL